MSPERAKTSDVDITQEWPYLQVTTSLEIRREYALMTLLALLATVALVYKPVPSYLPALAAFVAGWASNSWMMFHD